MENWKHIDKIFTGNIAAFGDNKYGNLTKEDVLLLNPPYLETTIIKPIGQANMESLIYKETIRYYRDGRVVRRFDYNSNNPPIDGAHILNPIGVKMVDYIKRKKNDGKEEDNDKHCSICGNSSN